MKKRKKKLLLPSTAEYTNDKVALAWWLQAKSIMVGVPGKSWRVRRDRKCLRMIGYGAYSETSRDTYVGACELFGGRSLSFH